MSSGNKKNYLKPHIQYQNNLAYHNLCFLFGGKKGGLSGGD